ncbi:hypothetical protein G9A89_018029 [Geosiphon pyriformis]|nr:hypothetical protein G9A89_018029 [Geosiphon pyriformis]
MKMAASLAKKKRININSNLKKQEMKSDQAVIIKKILINMPKDMIVAAFAELGQANLLVSKWLFLIGKNSVRIVKVVEDCETWALRDWFRALLFTLLVRTMAHDLKTLLDGAGGKTCIINRFLKTGNRIYCAVVSFESNNDLESAFHMKPILGGIKLFWTKMDLVWCEKCRKFGHSALKCNAFVLAKLYEKKNVPISHPTAFGGKSWAQVVTLAGPSDGLYFSSSSGSSLSLSGASDSDSSFLFILANTLSLNAHLATLEHSLELLIDQVSSILKKLSGMELKSMATPSSISLPATSTSLVLHLNMDMVLNDMTLTSAPSLLAVNDVVHDSSSSFSKILTSKVGRLESKMVAFKVSIGSVLERLDHLCFGVMAICNVRDMNNSAKQIDIAHSWLVDKFDNVCMFSSGLNSGYVDAGVAIVMNRSLAKHIYKVSEADEINSLIARAMNKSFFVILGGDFNEDGSYKCASLKKCHNLGLVNSLNGSFFAKTPTLSNFWSVVRTIDYVFVSSNLVNAIIQHNVFIISDHFDMDHRAVSVSLGLGGLLDTRLNSLCKQTNKD